MKQFKNSLIVVVFSTLIFQGVNWMFLNAFYNPVPEITWRSWLLFLSLAIFYEIIEIIRELPVYKIVIKRGDKVWYVIKKKSFLWFYKTWSTHDRKEVAELILQNLKNGK